MISKRGIALLAFVLSMNAQPPSPQRRQNTAKVVDTAQEDKFSKIIQGFFADFDKTKADTNERRAACEQVLSNLRPLAQERYAPAQWALAQGYLQEQIPSVSESRVALCPSLKSEKEGIVWLRRVADQGIWAARVRLAQLDATAEAGSLDLVEAYALYDVTKSGPERLCLSKLMSVEDIDRAQVLATKYGMVADPQMTVFKMAGVPLGLDYCAQEYRQVIQPEPNVGIDTAQIASELAKLTSATYSPLTDFLISSPLYQMPNGTQYRQGEPVASLNVNNQTMVPMIVLLRGKLSRVINVAAGNTGTVRVFPGTYQIGVQLGSTPGNTLRLYGEKALTNLTYELRFSQGASPTTAVRPDAASSTSAETDIRSEIDTIARSGRYSPLPDAQIGLAKDASATSATRIVRNDTAFALHVLMTGPVDRKIDLPPGGSTSIGVPPGSYRVAARADSPSILPFYGVQVLEVGIEYTSQFYIK